MSANFDQDFSGVTTSEERLKYESHAYAQQLLTSPASVGNDTAANGGTTAGLHKRNAGMERSVETLPSLAGKVKTKYDPRKYRSSAANGAVSAASFTVTRDDRMEVSEACDALESIRTRLGIKRGVVHDSVVASFDAALWYCHTVNSASRLNPGRSKFCAPGLTAEFDYLDVLDMLGTDARRFFRAFADDIADVNKRVLAEYDPYDHGSVEKYSWLMQVAVGKGLVQYPYLSHDSADACLRLTYSEREALAESKVLVLSNVTNVADTLQSNSRFK